MRSRAHQLRFTTPQGIFYEALTVPTGNLVWVDAVNGNDSVAVRGCMSVPFKTLTAAKAAAQSGDTIVVMPGVYNEKNLLKTGVNWHFMTGTRVCYDGGASGAIFDTGPNGTNGAVVSSITGSGQFSAEASNQRVIDSVASGSVLFFQANSLESSQAAAVRSAAAYGSLAVEADQVRSGSGDAVSIEGSSTENCIQARRIWTSGGCGVYVSAGSLELVANRIGSGGNAAIHVAGGSGQVLVRAFEIYSTANYAVYYSAASATITVFGARIVSTYEDQLGRAVQLASVNDKVRLGGCTLIASGSADCSIYAAASTRVHIPGGAVGNKGATNISWLGGTYVENTAFS